MRNLIMDLRKISIIKSDDRGIIYDCGESSFIVREKGSVSADHTHKDPETVYLVKGKVKLTIDKEIQIVQAPVRFEVASNVYHRLVALTDIELVVNAHNE